MAGPLEPEADGAISQFWRGLLELPSGQRGRSHGVQLRARAGRYRARILGSCTASHLEFLPVGEADFEVCGAGEPEVNGPYWIAGERDGVPHYVQPQSGVSLVRYRFLPSGRAYWFISHLDPEGNDRADLDLYRTADATEASVPPRTGWIVKAGQLPVPTAEQCRPTQPPRSARLGPCALSALGPTRRVRFEDVQNVWLEEHHVCLSVHASLGGNAAGACSEGPGTALGRGTSANMLSPATLRFSPFAADAGRLTALLQRRLLSARQCLRLHLFVAEMSQHCSAAVFMDRVLALDAMILWLHSLGLAAATALHTASRSLSCLHRFWRSIYTTSAHVALALAARHGRSAPVEALSVGRHEGEQPLSAAELREMLDECQGLHTLAITHQPAIIPLLRGGLAEALPPLRTLALGSCPHVDPAAIVGLLAAPQLGGLQSLTLDVPVAQACLELLFAREWALDLRPVSLLLASLVNVLQGPSPLDEAQPAASGSDASTATVVAEVTAVDHLSWPRLAELLCNIVTGSTVTVCGRPEVAGLAAWALGALLAQCSTDVGLRDLVGALRCVLDRISGSTPDMPRALVPLECLEGEDLRLATHAVLVLCQTAMLHRTRGVPRQLSAEMIDSGALGTLHAIASTAPHDQILQQRVLCVLDLFSYEAPEKWPQEEVARARELCRRALSTKALAEDDAVLFHAEALFSRFNCDSQEAPLLQQKSASWKGQLAPGDTVDAMDTEQAAWYEAQVVEVPRPAGASESSRVKVHFMGWHPRWDAWISLSTEAFRIQRRHRVVRPWRNRLGLMDRVDVKLPEGRTARELGYARDTDGWRFALPFGLPACSADHLVDLTSRTRWRSGEVLEVHRSGEDLWARVAVNARATLPGRAGRAASPTLAPAAARRQGSPATSENSTLGDLLQAGLVIEFWADLNGDFVQRAGTHTSRQRPVWGVLLRPPKTPHLCPEGGAARWGLAACPRLARNESRGASVTVDAGSICNGGAKKN